MLTSEHEHEGLNLTALTSTHSTYQHSQHSIWSGERLPVPVQVVALLSYHGRQLSFTVLHFQFTTVNLYFQPYFSLAQILK